MPSLPDWSAWSFERPWGLAAFLLPLILLWAARRRDRPREVFAGTFALFRGSDERPPESARARRRTSPRTWLWVLALVLGALGLAGPRSSEPLRGRTWRLVVDRSSSMGLPVDAGGVPRGERAVALALELLDAAWRAGDRAQWVAVGRPELLFDSPSERPVATWLAPDEVGYADGAGEPEWAAEDRPGALWITDAIAEPLRPRQAGLAESGGEAVPGPVGVDGLDRLDWDGERVVRIAAGAPPRSAVLDGGVPNLATSPSSPGSNPEQPSELEEFLRYWASARGIELVASAERADAPVVLSIVGPGSSRAGESERAPTRAEGAGWSARCRLVDDLDRGDSARGEPLLRDARGTPCLFGAPGRLTHRFTAFGAVEGDRGAFAHELGRWLDEFSLGPPGVLALAERRAAGEARFEPGLPPTEADVPGSPVPIAALCAALAAVLGALAASRAPRLATRAT